MKLKIKQLINLTFCDLCMALALIGIVLFSYFRNTSKNMNNITITINEEITTKLDVDLKEINPGSEEKYSINLDSEDLSLYCISLQFLEKDNKGNLDEYLTLVLNANDYKIEKNLHEVLVNEEKFDLGVNVKNIYVAYKMDESVGNEAQNATTDFSINLTAKIASK